MSNFPVFSQNGKILPVFEAQISLFNIEYSYGFGVYETLKLRNNVLYFVDEHLERLAHSATVIGIEMSFSASQIKLYLTELVQQLNVTSCNLKILLIGGPEISLYIFASAPLFPDRKLYRQGAKLVSYTYQRLFPTAKTLNMLPSYIAYKQALAQGCYDSLLIDDRGIVLEGTRTNFCLVKGSTIFRAPQDRVLGGVTFMTLEKIAQAEGFTIKEAEINLAEIGEYDGAFITSTSTKIMPIIQIDDYSFTEIPNSVTSLMKAYDTFLDQSQGVFQK
jgi:branched-subunit amino acid aminotransferase/4-amino-4-deoxychorismate lyase